MNAAASSGTPAWHKIHCRGHPLVLQVRCHRAAQQVSFGHIEQGHIEQLAPAPTTKDMAELTAACQGFDRSSRSMPCSREVSNDARAWTTNCACLHPQCGVATCRGLCFRFSYQPGPCLHTADLMHIVLYSTRIRSSLGEPCPGGCGCPRAHQLVACVGADDVLGCQLLRNLLRQVR